MGIWEREAAPCFHVSPREGFKERGLAHVGLANNAHMREAVRLLYAEQTAATTRVGGGKVENTLKTYVHKGKVRCLADRVNAQDR